MPPPVSSVTPQPKMPCSAHKVLDVHWPAPSTGLGYRVHCQRFAEIMYLGVNTLNSQMTEVYVHSSMLYREL